MTTSDPSDRPQEEILIALRDVSRRVRNLMVIVMVLLLFTILLAAAVFGSLVNYWSNDALFFGMTSAGGAILGFLLGFLAGWLARRKT
jgi:NhaP-type Na+/H+ or K+/H+ antiporter